MATPEQAEIEDLRVAYQAYIETLRRDWLDQFRIQSRNAYEMTRPEQREEEIDACIAGWRIYKTPFEEAWWKERGYKVVWPDDDLQPMEVHRLETAQSQSE